jgi:predicted P-loop ATPase/GTPase
MDRLPSRTTVQQNIIEIISDDPDDPENLKPVSLFLNWYEFESLMKCIDRLRK